jgi:ubiquinone/menaquinone biosynthesis C-methylase UbiE
MTSKEYKDLSVKEFTKAAEIYESDNAGVYNMCKKDYPDVLAELEKEPFTDLLDCGCGTGPMLTLLHRKYPDNKYTGIDLTPRMIEVAKRKNMKNVELVVGDCENLPFADNSFDVVI